MGSVAALLLKPRTVEPLIDLTACMETYIAPGTQTDESI